MGAHYSALCNFRTSSTQTSRCILVSQALILSNTSLISFWSHERYYDKIIRLTSQMINFWWYNSNWKCSSQLLAVQFTSLRIPQSSRKKFWLPLQFLLELSFCQRSMWSSAGGKRLFLVSERASLGKRHLEGKMMGGGVKESLLKWLPQSTCYGNLGNLWIITCSEQGLLVAESS